MIRSSLFANVAELADARDLGSRGEIRPGSTPGVRIHKLEGVMNQQEKEKKIDKIVKETDWVWVGMLFINSKWSWWFDDVGFRVPTPEEIKTEAVKVLNKVCDNGNPRGFLSDSGITVIKHDDLLVLSFGWCVFAE